jgi:hypothetical protein
MTQLQIRKVRINHCLHFMYASGLIIFLEYLKTVYASGLYLVVSTTDGSSKPSYHKLLLQDTGLMGEHHLCFLNQMKARK